MSMVARPTNPRLAAVLDRLDQVKPNGRGYMARCPAHADRTPSLSVAEGRDGRVVLTCHAGCTFADVARAIGSDETDFFPPKDERGQPTVGLPYTPPRIVATYDYHDTAGTLLYQVVRYEPKDFRQRRPDGKGGWIWSIGDVEPVLYHLPDVLAAVQRHRPVIVCEGEKDADALREIGYCATTNAGGAKKWRETFGVALAGNEVIVFPDNDAAGQAHAEQVAATCSAHGSPVQIVALPDLPPKGDVSDWLAAGGTLDALDALIEATPLWRPTRPATGRWLLRDLWADESIMRPPAPIVPHLAWAKRSTLFAAPEKAGKSTLCGYVTAAVSRGGDFLGEPCNHGQPGTVLVIGLEEFLGDTARRLREFGADGDRVHLVDALPGDPHARIQQVRDHIEATRPVLCLIDTLFAYANGAVSDASASAQMGPVVQDLTDLAHKSEPSILLLHHARKSDGRYRDSSAIGGAVDVIAEMYAPDEAADPCKRLVRVRGRVPVGDVAFRWTGYTYQLANHSPGADALPLDDRILAYLRTNPGSSSSHLRQAMRTRAAETDAAIERLLTSGRVVDQSTGTYHSYRVAPPYPNDRRDHRHAMNGAFGDTDR